MTPEYIYILYKTRHSHIHNKHFNLLTAAAAVAPSAAELYAGIFAQLFPFSLEFPIKRSERFWIQRL